MRYEWSAKKNAQLKAERGVSFEQVIFHLSQGDLWKVGNHPNQEKYPGQKIYFVVMDDYIYLIPYENRRDEIFLMTIIPSRKATRDYKKEKAQKNEAG